MLWMAMNYISAKEELNRSALLLVEDRSRVTNIEVVRTTPPSNSRK
jgi:hypothetical protein